MAKRKTIIARMDKKARECIRLRDDYKCQFCGKQGNDVHHIRMRKFYSTRWHLDNLIFLCRECHSGVDYNPTGFMFWLGKNYPARICSIEFMSKMGKKDTWRDADLKEIEDYLDQKLKELRKGE